MEYHIQENDNSASLHFLIMFPDTYILLHFLFVEGNSATFQNILIILGSNIE